MAATIKRREEQAVQRIAQAEASAVQDVRDQAVELAIGVATKLIAEKMDKSVQGSLIEASTNDVIKSSKARFSFQNFNFLINFSVKPFEK